MQLIAEGKTNKQIADILSISTKTVETHRALALRKLNLDTTAGPDPLRDPQRAGGGVIIG